MRDDPVGAPFVDDRLTRLPAIVADLEAIYGAGWRDEIAPSEATATYVARLEEVCPTLGRRLRVAHHYVRYLGDLSGGR